MAHDILIVDDEADIRMLIAGILNDEGIKTREAADADLNQGGPPAEMGRQRQHGHGRARPAQRPQHRVDAVGAPDPAALARLGVSRISYGPGPYRAMMEKLKEAAAAIYSAN